MRTAGRTPKEWIFGQRLASSTLERQLLSKRLALPIFASDALSSVAYAPQELVMILLIGGVSFLTLAPWVAAAVVVLLAVVVISYRQLIRAYPSGGGDYEVTQKNLGERASLVVASALLVDYILTVAVSVASGVDNIISALPYLGPWRVELCVLFVALIAAANLRGVREASKAFAIPTYLFIGSVGLMIVQGLVQSVTGSPPVAESAAFTVDAEQLTQAGMVLLVLRAFASGCSALTGVEAISNGVPAFRRPKVRNAQRTLVWMGTIAIVLFAGLTTLAIISGVHYAEDPCSLNGWAECATSPQPSLMAQIAAAVFGADSVLFFVVQGTTAMVLLLAANTAFNGFPLLGSILARDAYAPKALLTRGDRLVFSNGVIALALAATAILVVYQASVSRLIQLYIIGVFISFTLGQIGMVRHWLRLLPGTSDAHRPPVRRVWGGLVINGLGAVLTGAVLLVVTVTKFTHGAWLVFVIMPLLYLVMFRINRYYGAVEREIALDETTRFGSVGDHAIVLVSRLQKPALKALDYAIAARHDSLECVHIATDDHATETLQGQWDAQEIPVPLTVLSSPFRDFAAPLIDHIHRHRAEHGPEVVTVYVPQYIVGHWWENLLHNHRARRIRQRLMVVHGVTVALVPWRLGSSELLFSRSPRPMPGDDRRGNPHPGTQRPSPPADDEHLRRSRP